jgi:hypothetical protein
VTPDIQVIEPAGKRATTAFLTGLRLQMQFWLAKSTIVGTDISIDKGYRGRIIEALSATYHVLYPDRRKEMPAISETEARTRLGEVPGWDVAYRRRGHRERFRAGESDQ